MLYGIVVENLTEEQLNALEIINAEVAKVERERRFRESKYQSLEEVVADGINAYSILRALYDNMRNNDTKKAITSSGVIDMLEKLVRTGGDIPMPTEEVVVELEGAGEKTVSVASITTDKGLEEIKEIEFESPAEKIAKEVSEKMSQEVMEEIARKATEKASENSYKYIPTPTVKLEEVSPVKITAPDLKLSGTLTTSEPDTSMDPTPSSATTSGPISQEKLNEILANIPVIPKI